MTEVFADLNDRDSRGLFSALIEDAVGSVSAGDRVRVVDDEGSHYLGTVAEVDRGLIFFTLEPGNANPAVDGTGTFVYA